MVNPKKETIDSAVENTTDEIFLHRLYNIELVAQSIMFNVGLGVGGYILLDTFRQSVIAMASK